MPAESAAAGNAPPPALSPSNFVTPTLPLRTARMIAVSHVNVSARLASQV